MIDKVAVWLEQTNVLEAVTFNVGTFASAVIFTVPVADTHPLTVLVTCTVNTPLPFATGLFIVVLLKLPVVGTVHTYVELGSELLLALKVAVGLAQVVVKLLGVNVKLGEAVFV